MQGSKSKSRHCSSAYSLAQGDAKTELTHMQNHLAMISESLYCLLSRGQKPDKLRLKSVSSKNQTIDLSTSEFISPADAIECLVDHPLQHGSARASLHASSLDFSPDSRKI
jgi:hypothetical protein